jgi:hypothetical protein
VCNCDTNGQCEYKEVLEKKNPGRCLTKVWNPPISLLEKNVQ